MDHGRGDLECRTEHRGYGSIRMAKETERGPDEGEDRRVSLLPLPYTAGILATHSVRIVLEQYLLGWEGMGCKVWMVASARHTRLGDNNNLPLLRAPFHVRGSSCEPKRACMEVGRVQ